MRRLVMETSRAIVVAVTCASSAIGLAQDKRVLGVVVPRVGQAVTCTSSVDCTAPSDCSISHAVDSRSCAVCVASSPWGGCLIQGNDPVCEALKASQNAAYAAEAARQMAACEQSRTMSRTTCEAAKLASVESCEKKKRSAVTDAAPLAARYRALERLATSLKPAVLPDAVERRVYELLGAEKRVPLAYFKVVDERSVFGRMALLWSPDRYARGADVPDVGLPGGNVMQSVGRFTFYSADHDLTAEDIVRTATIAVFFEALGTDGIAQLQRSGLFDLSAIARRSVSRVCELMYQRPVDGVLCSTKISLGS